MSGSCTATLPTHSRAAVLVEPGRIEVTEFELPVLGEDDALLKVEACGICGTDYEQFDGQVTRNDYYEPIPAIPGHEPLGRIAAIGARASARWAVAVGDRVAVRSAYGCGFCDDCARFEPFACPTRGGTYGLTDVSKPPQLWGAYAEYMYLHPLSVVRRVDPELPPELAVMFNPLAAGLSWASTVPETGEGDIVVIFGPGQRGLCSVVAAREAGAETVVVTGLPTDAHKLELAHELGADATIVVDGDPTADVLDATGGGASVVVDTTPFFVEALPQAIAIARRRARIVLAGLKGPDAVSAIPVDPVVYNELSIRGVLSMPIGDFDRACRLIEDRRYPLERLHTHSFGLDDAALALATLAGRVEGQRAVHVTIEPFA